MGATRNEFRLVGQVLKIPGARIKAGREVRVPLSARAVEILEEMAELHSGEGNFVFPSQRARGPVWRQGLHLLLQHMGVDANIRGFSSSFRDWVGERTSFPREVAEAALAHLIGDVTERAYRRGDALEKRREHSAARVACPFGETYTNRTVDRARCWRCLCRRACLEVVVFQAVTSR